MTRARRTDPETSHAAGVSVASVAITERRKLLLAYYASGEGLTDEEAAMSVGARGCWWKRCSELRALGCIRDTGRTRVGESGRARIVCEFVKGEFS